MVLKVLKHRYAEDEEFVGRFEREARNAAALSHPSIVSFYDRGPSEDGATPPPREPQKELLSAIVRRPPAVTPHTGGIKRR